MQRRSRFPLRGSILPVLLACATIAVLARAGHAARPVPVNAPAPELVGNEWLNTEGGKPIRLSDRRGQVTVLHFWTFG